MKDINIAVIGWGFMGRMHTYALRSIPLMYGNLNFRPVLKLLCSAHIENAYRGMTEAGFAECCGDWREILTRGDIDVVSVCTPNALHEEMICELARAGKHLYIDKPLTTSLESAKRIKTALDAYPVKAQMVMNNRFLPAVMRAKQLAREGRLGRLLSFSCRYLHSGSIDPNKPIGWKQGVQGGVILDLASHAMDLVCDMVGYPKQVYCAVNSLYDNRPTKDGALTSELGEDHALMLLRMENGALGSCEASKISTGANDELTFEIYGDKGAVKFDLMEPNWLWFFDNTLREAPLGGERGFTKIECVGRYPYPAGSFPPPKNAVGWDRGHIHCYYSFLNCVANNTEPSPDIDDAIKLQALMEAAKQSAAIGNRVNVQYDF